VLPVASIPEAVIRYARTRPRMPDSDDEAGAADRTSPLLHKIFAQVRARTGRDFTRYKRSTILRRISRRMQLHQVEELAAYLELLRAHPGEIFELADDLLITVTSFFRDPAVFEKLERKIIRRSSRTGSRTRTTSAYGWSDAPPVKSPIRSPCCC
jgi:two-component system CheB/CheR fusion protein